MKRCTFVALLAAAALFAGCTKKEAAAENKAAPAAAAPIEAAADAAPAAPPAAPAAHPSAAAPAHAGDPVAAPSAAESAAAAAAAAGPTPTDAEVEAAGTKLVAMFEKLGDAIATNAGDCAAMATAIKKVGAAHKDFLQEARKWQNDPAAQSKMTAWLTKNGAMEKTQQKMMEGLTKCGQDPTVMSAITEMMGAN